jgi:hypothetical protein
MLTLNAQAERGKGRRRQTAVPEWLCMENKAITCSRIGERYLGKANISSTFKKKVVQ